MQYNYHPPGVQKLIHYHYHYTNDNFLNQSANVIYPISYQNIPLNPPYSYQHNLLNKHTCMDLQYWRTYKNPQIDQKYKEILQTRGRIMSQYQFCNIQEQRNKNKCYNLMGNYKEIESNNYKIQRNQQKNYNKHKNQKKIKIKIHPLDKQFLNSQIQKYQQYLDRYKKHNYSSYQNNKKVQKINKENKKNYINLRQRPKSTISFGKQSGEQFGVQNILGVSKFNSYLFTQRHQNYKPQQQNQQGSLILKTSQRFKKKQRISNKNHQICTSKFFDSKDLRMTAQTNFQSTCQSNLSFQQNKKPLAKKQKEFNNESATYQATQSCYINLTSRQQQKKEDLEYKYNLLRQQCTYLREKFVSHFKKVHKKKL